MSTQAEKAFTKRFQWKNRLDGTRMRLESGWSDEDALTIPVRKRTRGYRQSASCVAKMEGGDNDANKEIN